MLNKINVKTQNKRYRARKRLRIEQFLSPIIANELKAGLSLEPIPMHLAHFLDGEPKTMPSENFTQLSVETKAELQREWYKLAAVGVGYVYETLMPSRLSEADQIRDHPTVKLLTKVCDALVSGEAIDRVREITGNRSIKSADAQVTRFGSGHYLTRHRDDAPGKNRQCAYVLSLSHDWHPDWGGLLNFYDQDGSINEVWIPKFNTLALFDIQHIHSVSYVTPYARTRRWSITGWYMG